MPVVLSSPLAWPACTPAGARIKAARAAQAAGVPFSLSTVGICTIEEVARSAAPPWFQLYMIKDRGFMAELLSRAREAACPVLLFTVDLPIPGARHRDTRNRMTSAALGARIAQGVDGLAHPAWLWDVQFNGRPHTLGNVAAAASDLDSLSQFWRWIGSNFDPSVTWKDIDWVRERWPGPLVLKGVLDVEDASEAVRCGVDGIVVSNHGELVVSSMASPPERRRCRR